MDATGLTHLGAREYDPTLGSFISVDPIVDLTNAQQMNGYTYSSNNPITFTDPSGLFEIKGDGDRCRSRKGPKAPPTADKVPTDVYAQMHDNTPVLGKMLDNNALEALKQRGYKGSALFTRREALAFAAQSAEAAAIVCQANADATGTSPSACEYDISGWDELSSKLEILGESAYQFTPPRRHRLRGR